MHEHHENPVKDFRRGSAPSDPGTHIDLAPLIAKDRLSGSTECLSLLASYAQCLRLRDPQLRWQAQRMFNKSQMARDGGGTMGQKLEVQLRTFLREYGASGGVNK